MAACVVDDCDLPARARGWCNPHYMRWYQHGDPLAGGPVRQRRRAVAAQPCAIPGCDRRRSQADGLCKMHGSRRRRHGDPTVVRRGGRPSQTCSAAGCSERRAAHGYCRAHLYRWQRYGDPLTRPSFGNDWQARFWSHVTSVGQAGCWNWDTDTPYASFDYTADGVRHRNAAHRLAYELEVGPIPEGLVLDHLCNNPRCVKPAHLEPVTQRENLERGWLRRLGLRVDLVS